MTSAIDEAVTILKTRLNAALDEVEVLRGEIVQITGALQRLGYSATQDRNADTEAAARASSSRQSVTAATLVVMMGDPGPWTPSSIKPELERRGVKGGRADKQFADAIRTAFYTLRKRGMIVTDSNHYSMAMKWRRDAEAPAATGASDSEESTGDSSWKEGEPHGAGTPGSDHDAVRAAHDLGHGDRAALVGGRV